MGRRRHGAMRRLSRVGLVMAVLLLSSAPVAAEPREGLSLGGGIGVAESEFMLSFEAPFALSRRFSVGPLLQLAVEEDAVLVMASANGRLGWRIAELMKDPEPVARRIGFFLQGGAGMSHLSVDRGRGRDGDDTAFLINLGFGGEFDLDDDVVLTSHMLVNFHVGELFGDGASFSWQVLGARYRF